MFSEKSAKGACFNSKGSVMVRLFIGIVGSLILFAGHPLLGIFLVGICMAA